MTLIQIKNKDVLALPVLFRVALKSIYDKKHLTAKEQTEMEDSIIKWQNHLELRRDIGFTAVDEEHQMALEIIGSLLYEDSEGKLDRRKELFKRHNIDYRKFHRLPEAYKPVDFQRGQEALKDHMRTNPEYYT